jgi:hypothetical protein
MGFLIPHLGAITVEEQGVRRRRSIRSQTEQPGECPERNTSVAATFGVAVEKAVEDFTSDRLWRCNEAVERDEKSPLPFLRLNPRRRRSKMVCNNPVPSGERQHAAVQIRDVLPQCRKDAVANSVAEEGGITIGSIGDARDAALP